MKTLEGVIKALSMCGRQPNCKGCPYENVSYPTEIGNTCIDIMHYDALYYMQDRTDVCQEANPPLTWNELQEMEGKPVWIETDNVKFWTVINNFKIICNQECLYCSKGYMCRSTYVRGDWKAYRKE